MFAPLAAKAQTKPVASSTRQPLAQPSTRTNPSHTSSASATVPPRLVLGENNDPLEREADRVAEQATADHMTSAVSISAPGIQRAVANRGDDETGLVPA